MHHISHSERIDKQFSMFIKCICGALVFRPEGGRRLIPTPLSFRLIRETPTPKIKKCRKSLRPALLLYDHQTSPPSPSGPRPLVALPMLYREGCRKSTSAKTTECIHPPHALPQSTSVERKREEAA